jgi:transcriptional regulator with XRE-family HTH domain
MDPVRLGLSIRALRRRRGWAQQRLADEARVSRSTLQRIERGGAEQVTGRVLRDIATALGARFEQRILWQGEALDRLLDQDHARIVELVVRWLRSEGWMIQVEATFAIAGERGSIDVLAFHEATGTLLVIEVKSVLPDMQGLLVGVDRKARLAPVLAHAHGWAVRKVAKLVVLPGDSTTRRRVATHAATLDVVLPARTSEVRRWAHNPEGALAGILFLPRRGRGSRHRVAARTDRLGT